MKTYMMCHRLYFSFSPLAKLTHRTGKVNINCFISVADVGMYSYIERGNCEESVMLQKNSQHSSVLADSMTPKSFLPVPSATSVTFEDKC